MNQNQNLFVLIGLKTIFIKIIFCVFIDFFSQSKIQKTQMKHFTFLLKMEVLMFFSIFDKSCDYHTKALGLQFSCCHFGRIAEADV